MLQRDDLKPWILEALVAFGGSGSVVQVCRHIWQEHETDLRSAGDLFFTWQHDIHLAATNLRQDGKLAPADYQSPTPWKLADNEDT
jgi:hypothetical protein